MRNPVREHFLYVALPLFLLAAVIIQEHKPHLPLKDQVTFKFNEGFPSFSPEITKVLSFGYSRAFSALLWIRFLRHSPVTKVKKGEVSWVWVDLNTISVIDPDFSPVYTSGGVFLSVITQDKEGARLLLEKGVKKFPKIWQIKAFLAYHYQYELNDFAKAAEQYRIAATIPGSPHFFPMLAATLTQKSGDSRLAIAFLEEMLKNTKSDNVKEGIKKKLDKLRGKNE